MIKVVINNRNRLTTTKNMVEKLLELNPSEEIVILDNGSTYPPLLEWYKTIHCEKYLLDNHGHLALWSSGVHKYIGDYFVYTDSDIILNDNFPKNWMLKMYEILQKYNYNKVSLALEVNDLPDHYRYKNQVMRNENRWWLEQVEDGIFKADTDTTFSLYKNIHDNVYPSLRIAKDNMICKHKGWYDDLDNLNEEERYYLEHLGERVTTQYSKQHKNPDLYQDI